MRQIAASILALAGLLLGACSGGGGEWQGTVTDSAGVAIVSNTDRGTWTPQTQWTLEEELKIGATEGDPDYQFGQIGFIAVDSRNRIFVLDAQAQHVKIFSADGAYETTVGGPGAGPGELAPGAVFLLVGPGDTLIVPDLRNRRVNRYGPDGSSLGSFPLEIEKGLPLAWRGTSSGLLAYQARPLNLPGVPATDSMDAIIALSPSGVVTDTLLRFPSGGTLNLGGGTPEINLYSPEPVWGITDDGRLLYGMNDDYRIGMYSANGDLERVITKPFEQQPVSERDQRAIMSYLERAWTDAGVPPQALARLRSIVHFGEFFPAFAGVLTGPSGTLWVQHTQSAAALSEEELEDYNIIEQQGAPDWDVFDADGRFLGLVTMPPRFAPRLIRGNEIYGVWRDELDVQHVARMRIVGSEGVTD